MDGARRVEGGCADLENVLAGEHALDREVARGVRFGVEECAENRDLRASDWAAGYESLTTPRSRSGGRAKSVSVAVMATESSPPAILSAMTR